MRAATKLGFFARSLLVVLGASLLAGAKPPDRDHDGVPDSKDACPKVAATPGAKGSADGCPVEATYIGFSVGPGGGGMVFVQLTDVVPVEVSQSQSTVSLLLKGARVFKKNNFNPLPAAAFGSVLQRAQLLPDKAGVRLVLQLKSPLKLSQRVNRQGSGAALEVDIPASGQPRQ